MILKFLILVGVTVLVKGHNHEEDWTHNVIYYDPENLTCSNSQIDPAALPSGSHLTWILPSGEILQPGAEHSRVEVAANGHWLNIIRTNDEDFGVYNCLIFVNGLLSYNVRVGVNVNGPFWGHLSERYVPRAITAAISAAITFSIACIMCFFYERMQGRGERAIDDYEAWQARQVKAEAGKSNEGFDPEMQPTGNPEKPPIDDVVKESQTTTKF